MIFFTSLIDAYICFFTMFSKSDLLLLLFAEIGRTKWSSPYRWLQTWLVRKSHGNRETVPYHVDGGCYYTGFLSFYSYVYGNTYYRVSASTEILGYYFQFIVINPGKTTGYSHNNDI